MRVKWLRNVAQNPEDAYDYLEKDNPEVAQAFLQDVYRLVNLLPAQPAMGLAGRVVGTRELVIQDYPFIIPYRVVLLLWNGILLTYRVFKLDKAD